MKFKKKLKILWHNLDKTLLFVVVFAIASRFFVLGIGSFFQPDELFSNFEDRLSAAWVQWDGEHYRGIINTDYDKDFPGVPPQDESCNLGLGLCQRNFAFFPLYPLSVKLVQQLIPLRGETLGIILSNLYFVIGVVVLYKLAMDFLGKRKAFLISLIAMVFPVSYVFSGLMSESLFFMLLVLTYYLAHKKYWFWAILAGGLLSATRIVGILVLLPLLLLHWEQNVNKYGLQKLFSRKTLAALVIVPLGLILFMVYLKSHTGDALAFLHIQDYWEKPISNLNVMSGFFTALVNYRVEGALKNHLYNLSYFVLAMGLLIWSLVKKIVPLSMSTILLWIVIPMTAGTTLALPRYLLPLFPVYILLGIILSRNKYLAGFYLFASTMLLIYLTRLYVNGNFLTA